MGAKRADVALYARGLFESRAKAQEAIAGGLVTANGRVVKKPSEPIDDDAEIVATAPYPWVSRGGVKLAHALDHFGVNPEGRYCLDIGASTGGFTDVLLARGARHVVAVDVGHDQLHAKLRTDARITSMEGQDARTLMAARLAEPASLIVIDASFISLAPLLPNVLSLAAPEATLIALIKPQFEAGRMGAKKGVVRDARIHAQVCARARSEVENLGWRVKNVIASPIEGGDGNREFLLCASKSA